MCLAIPGEVLSISGEDMLSREGRIRFAGIVKSANLAFTPEANPGDYVLVHAGFAIGVIDEAQATRTLDLLEELP